MVTEKAIQAVSGFKAIFNMANNGNTLLSDSEDLNPWKINAKYIVYRSPFHEVKNYLVTSLTG